jgi:hypothetical protein
MSATTAAVSAPKQHFRAARALWVIGPGMMVMIADTDAGRTLVRTASRRPRLPDLVAANLGAVASRLTLALGIAGAALLASLVVSLAASWAVAEAFGSRRSLNDGPQRAPLFYGIYAAG